MKPYASKRWRVSPTWLRVAPWPSSNSNGAKRTRKWLRLLLKINGQALEATTGNMIHLLRHLYDLSKEECLKIVEEVTAEADRHIDILGDEAFANASATRH